MRTFSIRVSEHSKQRIHEVTKARGLSLNALGKLIVYRTIELRQFPKQMRIGDKQPKAQRLDFKIERNELETFRTVCHEQGIKVSDLFRHYLRKPDELFQPYTNHFKNRQAEKSGKDYFQTPPALTNILIDNEPLDAAETILEPACGRGAIVDVLRSRGFRVEAFDKHFGEQPQDFFEFTPEQPVPVIITNPPFNYSMDFLEHAMRVSMKAIFLLPLDYLQGKARLERWYKSGEFHCSRVYVLSRRPLLNDDLQADGVARTGSITFAWFVFERGSGKTELIHLDGETMLI